MSISHHHSEWQTLLDLSGPFLSLPVLTRVFPQGLDQLDPAIRRDLRAAYDEWKTAQQSLRPDPRLQRAWIEFVLSEVLGFPDEVLADDQVLQGLSVAVPDEEETLSADLAVVDPDGAKPRLVLTVWPASQDLHRPVTGRGWKASPATRLLALIRGLDIPLGLASNGEQWLLVHAPRGETASFVTWLAGLWSEEPLSLRALVSLLGVRRFFSVAEADRLPALFAESSTFQQEVTDQLGAQVRRAVEIFIRQLDRTDRDRGGELLGEVDEPRLYQAGVTLMMRLVFLLFAEERGLLLLEEPLYDRHYAVSTLRGQLREAADRVGEATLERRYDAYSRLLALFRMVHGGVNHQDLRLPAYGGELFDPDRFPFLEGRIPGTRWRETSAEPLPISNRTVLHLLEALQRLEVPGRAAQFLSFRALDVEQIGHVYESLLDHTARRASEPLLGLAGGKGREPEVALRVLETHGERGEAALVAFLKDETGRSPSALRKALNQATLETEDRLRVACDNDEALLARVRPFAGLLRLDSTHYPLVIGAGSVFVTEGSDRRATGTHYTPPGLTEEIVRHTLDPLVYRGMAEGVAPSPETLKSSAALLALKIVDPACGSGAFLVQACRYLAEKVVMAWEREGEIPPDPPLQKGGEDGQPDSGAVAIQQEHSSLVSRDTVGEFHNGQFSARSCLFQREVRRDFDHLASARRLVADRCLYGVDVDSMACEMAKLSLWLVTLQKGKPFTFLDHAIRHGDSLLGIRSAADLAGFAEGAGGQMRLSGISDALDLARARRVALEAIPDEELDQVEKKGRLLREAEAATDDARLVADALVVGWLETAGKRGGALDEFLDGLALLDGEALRGEVAARLRGGERRRWPFHWGLEFPEVFEGGGFDAVVGNPPFQGGQRITGALGTDYRDYLVGHLAEGKRGSADLSAYFLLRAGRMLREGGGFGLLATNTIAQGDTREVGLAQLRERGFVLPRAVSSRKWPGTANLEVAFVWARRGEWRQPFVLDDKVVKGITPYLSIPGKVVGEPRRLAANADKSFQGSIVLGMGFVLEPEEAAALIARDERNREALFPYLNGEDLNSRPDQSPSRWVINFHDWPLDRSAAGSWVQGDEKQRKDWLKAGRVPGDYPGRVAADFPELLGIVEEKVRPERTRKKANGEFALRYPLYLKWWIYAEKRPKLYSTISSAERVLVRARIANMHSMCWVPGSWVYNEKTVVFVCSFAATQSSLHELWARKYSSTLRQDMQYTPSDCFETYPFPPLAQEVEQLGEKYQEFRRAMLLENQQGLTTTYNRFHTPSETAPDITHLRTLHTEMDQAVAAAYGWTDLDLGHGFHETRQGLRYTLSEPARQEVLDRLLALNFERYEDEVRRGLHDKKGGKGAPARAKKAGRAKAPQQPDRQGNLDF